MALTIPLFMVTTYDESIGDCKWDWPGGSWMGAAYDTVWLALLAIIPLIVMIALYSRVVHTLWIKHNYGNELKFRRKVILLRMDRCV